MRIILLLIILTSCTKNIDYKQNIDFKDDISFNEFKNSLIEYTKLSNYPKIDE